MNPKLVLAALVLQLGIMLLPGVLCAVSRQYVTPKEDKPNECPLEDGSSLPIGSETPTQKFCGRTICQHSEEKLYLETHTCGIFGLSDDRCTLVSDYTKPYPGCCPQPQCPKS